MPRDRFGYPVIPHQVATRADCDGCLVVQVRGDFADLVCNMCDSLVQTVPVERAAAALLELGSRKTCSSRCPHCGGLNTLPGFSEIFAYTCSECGAGVSIEKPIQ